MHFEIITYRWGEDLVGGAELACRRLALELVELGHDVTVLTTTGHGFRPLQMWGNRWTEFRPQGENLDSGIRVRRFPMKEASLPRKLVLSRLLERQMAAERAELDPMEFAKRHPNRECEGAYLLTGWHLPEAQPDGSIQRWTARQTSVLVSASRERNGILQFCGFAPKSKTIKIHKNGELSHTEKVAAGNFAFSVFLEKPRLDVVTLEVNSLSLPMRDFRRLGILLNRVTWIPEADEETFFEADLWEDHRAVGRANPEWWQAILLDNAEKRPMREGRRFDILRGPISPGLERAVRESTADARIFYNLPWATLPLANAGDFIIPFWHIEDEYYYWPHYLAAMRKGLVLAATPHTAQKFFPSMKIEAEFLGVPVWAPERMPDAAEAAEFRQRFGLAKDDVVVLTVCRKSGEKRYEAVVRGVAALRKSGRPVRFIGIGPDADRQPIHHEGCEWLGKLPDADLQAAYSACDIFCLLSESESFGIVVPEAWHHQKPVIVNRNCGPTASLVSDKDDGLTTSLGTEFEEGLKMLVDDSEKRRKIGEAGKRKAERLYVRGVTAGRLLSLLGRS